jgi:N-ethylmaleimide reductase
MTSRPVPDLFTPLQAGAFQLAHRVVMPALSRWSASAGGVPTPQMAEHYGQRATAGGLIVCEAAAVCAGIAAPGVPGLHNAEQVNHWRLVTDAVHGAGGTVVAQLGLDGDAAVQLGLDVDGIERLLLDYRNAAENAGDAGFDGVELQAAHGALPERLLRGDLPQCASAYRGSADACMRFLNEALQSLVGVWGRDRVGVCLSPGRPDGGRRFGKLDALAFHALLLGALHGEGIAYLQLVEPGFGGLAAAPPRVQLPRVAALLRPFFPGVLVAAGGFDRQTATAALQSGQADAVAFGRGFIANPDLPARLRSGAALVSDSRAGPMTG